MIKNDLWDKYWGASSIKRWLTEKVRQIYFAGMFADRVKDFVKEGRVLEAGCGSAKILERLNNKYITIGCDISFSAANMAQGRCNYLIVCDIKKLPFKDKSFELIFNQGVMEHFEDTETISILREFKRVSCKTLIIVPANTSIFRIYNPFGDTPKGAFFSSRRLTAVLKEIFKIVKVEYMPRSCFLSIAGYGQDD